MTAQERQAQAIQNTDASDDAYCRKQADGTVTYDQCRKNLMQLRQAARKCAAASNDQLHEHALGGWRQNYMSVMIAGPKGDAVSH